MTIISRRMRYLGAVAGAAILAIGCSGVANAIPSYGYADLEFSNFTLSGVVGNPSVTVGATSVLVQDASNYPGFPLGGNAAAGTLLAGADPAQATSGPGPFPGANVYTQQMLASSGTRGDGVITGAIATGATSKLVAEGRLLVPPTAGSSAGSNTTITALFTALSATTVTLTFDAVAHLFTSVGQLGDTASAQIGATYTIVNNATGASVAISGLAAASAALNQTRSAQTPGVNGVYDVSLTGVSLVALLAPGTYTLTFSDSASEQLQAVAAPEPASLGLLGSGLLTLGLVARRRRAG